MKDLKLNLSQSPYVLDGVSSTVSPRNHLAGNHDMEKHDKDFVEVVSAFYATLSSRQVPLGSEFEKVLIENISDLYGS